MLLWAKVKPFRVSLVKPVAYLSDSQQPLQTRRFSRIEITTERMLAEPTGLAPHSPKESWFFPVKSELFSVPGTPRTEGTGESWSELIISIRSRFLSGRALLPCSRAKRRRLGPR
jgi:hypothetical protein